MRGSKNTFAKKWVVHAGALLAALNIFLCSGFGVLTALTNGRYWYSFGWPVNFARSMQSSDHFYNDFGYERWPLFAPGEITIFPIGIIIDAGLLILLLVAYFIRLNLTVRTPSYFILAASDMIALLLGTVWISDQLGVEIVTFTNARRFEVISSVVYILHACNILYFRYCETSG